MKIMNATREYDVHICYDITLACNNRCEYCYCLDDLDNKKKWNEETFQLFKQELAKLTDYRVRVSLVGGEPLVIHDKLHRVKELPISSLQIISNLNFPERNFEKILTNVVDVNPNLLAVSWHPSSKLDDVRRNILKAKEAGLNVVISYLLDQDNLDEIWEEAHWALNNEIWFVVDIIHTNGEDRFKDKRNAKYVKLLHLSQRLPVDLQIIDPLTVTIDESIYDQVDMMLLDMKDISKRYYTQCKHTALDVHYDGSYDVQCSHPYSGHLKDGLEIRSVFCDNHTCDKNVTTYKRLLRRK